MANVMDFFKTMLVIQLFFSFAMTGIAYTMPNDAKVYVSQYISLSQKINMSDVAGKVQTSTLSQTNIPLIDLGGLLFFSGNLMLDLFLNFIFAIPEMITLLISALMNIFSLDAVLISYVQLFAGVIFTIVYFLSLINMVISIRSGRMIE